MQNKFALLAALIMLLVIGGAGTAVLADHEPPPSDRGGFTDPTHLQLRSKTDQGTQVVNVRDASEVVVDDFGSEQPVTFDWHTHPGPVLVMVNSGESRYQHTDCSIDVYGPGEIALDPGQGYIHRAHATAGTELRLVFFGVPHGAPVTDALEDGKPDCPDPGGG